MVFSSSIFIFGFLPVTLLGYYLMKWNRGIQNVWLVAVSVFFYAWGEPRIVFLMLLSILMNYVFGLLADRFRQRKKAAYACIVGMLVYNLGVLFVFKYLMFAMDIIGIEAGFAIALPIGISFYTFQAISYVIDIYRGHGKVQKNPLNVALYITFFPQLIAGPIVRYETVARQIRHRRESLDRFSQGVQRFIIGLGKKLLLANAFAPIADYAFGSIHELSAASAWIGALCYSLQIYFDFSGYSDMAIGLGKMFGFEFLENFNYPYIAGSVTEFWRRWHISLGTWFKDYVYIPLGGSRVKHKARLIFNLFVVWSLTGIWHGANWTFICWGIWYFAWLVLEKTTGIPWKKPGAVRLLWRAATLLAILFGWVLFRADSLGDALLYVKTMFGVGTVWTDDLARFWLLDLRLLLLAGILAGTPVFRCAAAAVGKRCRSGALVQLAGAAGYLLLFAVCVGAALASSYNPFIYFNF